VTFSLLSYFLATKSDAKTSPVALLLRNFDRGNKFFSIDYMSPIGIYTFVVAESTVCDRKSPNFQDSPCYI